MLGTKRKTTLNKLLAPLLLLSLSACVSTGQQTKPSNVAEQTESAAPAVPAKPKIKLIDSADSVEVDVTTASAFERTEKVLVASFKVGFIQSKGSSVKAGGGLLGSGFGGKSTAFMDMQGIDGQTMQEITDHAYQHFMKQLQTAGYDVVDRQALYGLEAFQGVKRYDFPYKADNSGWFSDYGVTLIHAPTEFGQQVPVWPGEIQGVMGGIGFANPSYPATEFAEGNDIKILNVTYLLDFAYTEKYGGRWTQTSAINVGQAISALPGGSLNLVGGWGSTFNSKTGILQLKESIVAKASVGELKEVTSTTEKAVEMAINVISVLGGTGTNKTTKYQLTADKTAYRQAAIEVAEKTNNNFIQKMIDLQ